MKKLLIAVGLLITVCAFIGLSPYNDGEGDKEATYAQSLMRDTVKFEERLKIKITPSVDPIFVDLGDDSDGKPPEPKVVDLVSSGSGIIISNNKEDNTSVIFTAWHVCDRYPVGFKVDGMGATLEVVGDEQLVITNDLREVKILEILYKDKETDVCAVKAAHAFKDHAEIATKMPPRGAIVAVVGAPQGSWGRDLVSMSDGRYFGKTTIQVKLGKSDTEPTFMIGFAYYGFAGVGGYSGSGVFYKGKLIGLMTAGSTEYEHACYGPTVDALIWAKSQTR